MKKILKNQFVWITVGFCLLLGWGFVVYQSNQSKEVDTQSPQAMKEKTIERARLIGRSLIESNFQRKIFSEPMTTNAPTRGMASAANETATAHFELKTVEEGQTGRDPWGFPFSYRRQNNQLFIWSPGPNHQLESQPQQIEASQAAGDDILVSLAL